MKLQLFVLCCVLQSIYSYNVSDHIIYPPDMRSTRIVGGEDAPEGLAPFQCSMQLNRRHFCGCAILNSNFLLTASHCVVGQSARSVEILVGTNDLGKGGKYYEVKKLVQHEEYNSPPFANDIAVIELKKSIKFDEKTSPIEFDDEEVPDGAQVQLTGWGRLIAGGSSPQKLQVIKLDAVSTERCKEIYGGQNVHESHFCTLTRVGEGACNGDSGGPLVLDKKIVGVVNFGVSPCDSGYPDSYAKISYLYNWILQHTNSNQL